MHVPPCFIAFLQPFFFPSFSDTVGHLTLYQLDLLVSPEMSHDQKPARLRHLSNSISDGFDGGVAQVDADGF